MANPTLGLRLVAPPWHLRSPAPSLTSAPRATLCQGHSRPPMGQEHSDLRRRWHSLTSLVAGSIGMAIAAFFCFSFMASANYLVNDMLDIESDRRHPCQTLAPLRGGRSLRCRRMSPWPSSLVLTVVALLPLLPMAFALWLGALHRLHDGLFALSEAHCGGGCVAALGPLHPAPAGRWRGYRHRDFSLAGRVFHLPVSLARHGQALQRTGKPARAGRAPSPTGAATLVADLEQIRSFGTSSAYAAVVVFMLYIARPDVTALYHHATRLWLIVPLLIYWLFRVWLLASRGETGR